MSRLCNGDEQMMLFFSQKCYFTPSCSQRIEIFPFCVFQMSNALWYGESFSCCYLNLFEYWEYSSTGFKFNARPKPSMLFTNYVNPLEHRISGVIEHVARPLRCKFHAAHVWLNWKRVFYCAVVAQVPWTVTRGFFVSFLMRFYLWIACLSRLSLK